MISESIHVEREYLSIQHNILGVEFYFLSFGRAFRAGNFFIGMTEN